MKTEAQVEWRTGGDYGGYTLLEEEIQREAEWEEKTMKMNRAAAHSAATSAGNPMVTCNGPATLAAAAAADAAALSMQPRLIGPYVTHTTGCWLCGLVAAVAPTFTK